MGNKNEVVEHVVKVDDYMEVRLKIPKVLTAMELKGLMSKANNLFKLSEAKMYSGYQAKNTKKSLDNISSVTESVEPQPSVTKKKKKAKNKGKRKTSHSAYLNSGKNSELKKYIKKYYHKLGGVEIARRFDTNKQNVYDLAWTMRKKGIIK